MTGSCYLATASRELLQLDHKAIQVQNFLLPPRLTSNHRAIIPTWVDINILWLFLPPHRTRINRLPRSRENPQHTSSEIWERKISVYVEKSERMKGRKKIKFIIIYSLCRRCWKLYFIREFWAAYTSSTRSHKLLLDVSWDDLGRRQFVSKYRNSNYSVVARTLKWPN